MKEKRIITLYRRVNQTYVFEKALKIKEKQYTAETYSIGPEEDIKLNQSKPTCIKKLTKIYAYDIVTGAPLPFIAQEPIITPKQLNTVLNDKLIRDLHASMVEKPLPLKDMITYITVGACGTGFILMILIYLGVL